MGKLYDAVKHGEYLAGRDAGLEHDTARESARTMALAVSATASDAVKMAFAQVRQRMIKAVREQDRLRRERDALLCCLADVMGVSETQAWQVARLDMEQEREGRIEAELGAWEA